jgi:4-hydroxy-tetrahydrodipicolinate synthase
VNNDKVNWSGNFVAIGTPFAQSGEIDEEMFKANVALMIEEGAQGILVSGCTGEAWALAPQERLRLFSLASQVAGKDIPVIGGTSSISTDQTVDLSIAAIEAGCKGVLVMPPYYAVPGTRELRAHFTAISDRVKAPIFLYNMPKRTNINMAPSFLSELCDLEWIVAMKQSSNGFSELLETLAECGEKIQVFAGHSAERGFSAILAGCPGFVSSMEAQVMGREAIAMAALAKEGRIEEGQRVQQRTLHLDTAMRKVGTFPSNMKCAMNLLGRPGGYCRRPLLDLDASETAEIERILDGLGLTKRAKAA